MEAPATLTRAEFARHINRSKSYVTKLGHAGRLVFTESGRRVRVAESIARIQATADPNRDDVARRWADRRGEAPAGDPPDDAGMPDGDAKADPTAAETFARARARKETALADKAEMEAAVQAGSLVPVEEVARAGADAGAILRRVAENYPAQHSTELAGIVDVDQMFGRLTDLVEQLLSEFTHSVNAAAAKYDRRDN